MKVARSIQKPNQTKDQTKLIAQGIEKGITLYKKQQKEKQREADKLRKKQHKTESNTPTTPHDESIDLTSNKQTTNNIAWILLVISWVGFIAYISLA
ncbi:MULTISPECIES: DUF2956 domain-containing protein [Vibrio]